MSAVFGTMHSIVYSRPRPTSLGPVAYVSELKTLFVETSHLVPDAVLRSSLARCMVPLDGRAANAAPFGHDKPSNSLFIPPEHRSVNCRVCSSYIYYATLWASRETLGNATRFEADAYGHCILYVGEHRFYGGWAHSASYGDLTTSRFLSLTNTVSFDHEYGSSGRYIATDAIVCSCASIFSTYVAREIVTVDPSECSQDALDRAAIAELRDANRYPQEPFERGFILECNRSRVNVANRVISLDAGSRPGSDTSPHDTLPTRPRPGGGGQFHLPAATPNFSTWAASSGTRRYDNDQCVTYIPTSPTMAAFGHSHPYFESESEIGYGNGCFGSDTYPSGFDSLEEFNDANQNFSRDDMKAARKVKKPLYLLTARRDAIKVFRKRGIFWHAKTIWNR